MSVTVFFLEKVKACLPELYGWAQWCYVFPAEQRFGRRHILFLSGVQQVNSLGPLLFSLVLTSLFNRIPPTPGVLLSLWYLDDGTIAGSRPAVMELLHHIESLGPSFGLFLNKKKFELFWPAGDQTYLQRFADLLLVWICWALQFGALRISTTPT